MLKRSGMSWRLTTQYSSNWLDMAGRRQTSSKKFRDLRSSFPDMVHVAIGGAYCDIFTCDADASVCVGVAREKLGLPRQVSEREKGLDGFCRELLDVDFVAPPS